MAEHQTVDPAFWRGRRVLLTGHTGFKGTWTALWLSRMGATVTGLGLAPGSSPSLFEQVDLPADVDSQIVDIRDRDAVAEAVERARPDIALHLAAQALVRESVRDPVGTIATNVLGTAHVLDALRGAGGLSAILVVTSDKVYAHADAPRAFVEGDRLGGKDPYSASKAATEMVAASYAQSFFDAKGVPLATARGGNVVGGGDFSADRLIPDLVRAIESRTQLVLRHPGSTRPWQHVLDCVAGYLTFAQALVREPQTPRALNFGPHAAMDLTVGDLATALCVAFDAPLGWRHEPDTRSVEMHHLAIDPSLAAQRLGFQSVLGRDDTVRLTADWYRAYLRGDDLRAITLSQIEAYMQRDRASVSSGAPA